MRGLMICWHVPQTRQEVAGIVTEQHVQALWRDLLELSDCVGDTELWGIRRRRLERLASVI